MGVQAWQQVPAWSEHQLQPPEGGDAQAGEEQAGGEQASDEQGAGVPLQKCQLNFESPLVTLKPWYANRHTWQAAWVALAMKLLRAT